jgi:rRNA-processing protein FCF1
MKSTARHSESRSAAPDVPSARGRTVLLDANVLFLPFSSGTDLEAETVRLLENASLAVPSTVFEELRRLAGEGVPLAEAALALALQLPSIPNTGSGDDAILRLAQEGGYVVATADAQFRGKLIKAGIDVLAPRDRTRLTLLRGARRKGQPSTPRRGNR